MFLFMCFSHSQLQLHPPSSVHYNVQCICCICTMYMYNLCTMHMYMYNLYVVYVQCICTMYMYMYNAYVYVQCINYVYVQCICICTMHMLYMCNVYVPLLLAHVRSYSNTCEGECVVCLWCVCGMQVCTYSDWCVVHDNIN